ncbi:MAG TPA: hypothetical protein VGO58_17985 [Chitinophagaceae bacterium]|jgi:hypothetical protein|nr:hypothetical protein [Chitinophagaceae bacterium]
MELYKIALLDVMRENRAIVLIKGKRYQLFKDPGSGQFYFQGEDGLSYLLEEHREWFDETPGILPFIV